ncbi:Bug family tripartite tricarboxylate transporter substrate binding protein [Variovorax paradoxus]|nr:Bug family tripartite tricarboxylate transporter substrate binding protein [Variovorax paradoxus]
MIGRRELVGLPAAALLAAIANRAIAQPRELVRIVNGFPPGGTADTCSRRVAERIGGTIYSRNPGIVENRAGAGGRIACEVVKAAPADGSVLLLTPYACMAIYPHIYSKLSYDPMKDFVPVSTGTVMTHALTVGPLVPPEVQSVKSFLHWAKANPAAANYGSPGAGITPHFIAALLGLNAGVELNHIPYRGSVPAVSDMIAGQVAATSTPTGDVLANYRAGKCRILATTGAERSAFAPQVPTFAEQGFPELTAEEWFGFYAPAKTPPEVVAMANAAINAALNDKSVGESLAVMGLQARGSTSAEMARSHKEEYERWRPIIKRIGFKAES